MTFTSNISIYSPEDPVSREYFNHSSAQRVNTDAVLVEALRRQYPDLQLVVSPVTNTNLIAYASAGFANAIPLEDVGNDPIYGAALKWRTYLPPSRRLDSRPGTMMERVLFGKYSYHWKDQEFLLYVANGRDGGQSYPDVSNHYILARDIPKVDLLLKEATLWAAELHDEVWVFDQGYWGKSRELWDSVQKSHWSDVILEEDMKKAIIDDVENFFDNRETYQKLKVPWKRGIIYYGPPGNGKTISIKSMMNSLYQRGRDNNKQTVPTLYVRSLASFGGPEYALQSIFNKARQTAPCYLVFEDLDSIVNDDVRSYFLNEVDGLKSNDGILMVGSTNHLDRLDPGISKRPSRFDRKYYFPDPDFKQRVQYAQYWQGKLKDNKDIEFPYKLCPAFAKITDDFSFAYMQEAFVAALLAIAVNKDSTGLSSTDNDRWSGPEDALSGPPRSPDKGLNFAYSAGDDGVVVLETDLEKLVLWRELRKQVRILRDEMEEKRGNDAKSDSGADESEDGDFDDNENDDDEDEDSDDNENDEDEDSDDNENDEDEDEDDIEQNDDDDDGNDDEENDNDESEDEESDDNESVKDESDNEKTATTAPITTFNQYCYDRVIESFQTKVTEVTEAEILAFELRRTEDELRSAQSRCLDLEEEMKELNEKIKAEEHKDRQKEETRRRGGSDHRGKPVPSIIALPQWQIRQGPEERQEPTSFNSESLPNPQSRIPEAPTMSLEEEVYGRRYR